MWHVRSTGEMINAYRRGVLVAKDERNLPEGFDMYGRMIQH